LPPKLHDSLYFGMTTTQAEWYWRAKEEILLNTTDDELLESYTIFRLFTALQQIICGFWNRYPDPPPHPGPRGRYWSPENWEQWTLDHPRQRTPELITFSHVRLDMLARAIHASDAERIIIWANHQQSIADIDFRLTQEFGPGCVAHFHGAVPVRERGAQLERWRRSARFLVMTQASGGHGLTLNEATHHIFYSNGFKFSERLQAEDRSHRIGQTKPVTYTDLVCTNSIDERIQKALGDKENAFNGFRREVERFKDGSREEVRKLLMSI
jgi:SNF2 family DNA or RNA helicase